MRKLILFLGSLLLSLSLTAHASTNEYNSDFDYLLGNWRIDMQMRNEQGEFVALAAPAFMRAQKLEDNHTIQTRFSTDSGFFSTDLRSFDRQQKVWRVMFMNARDQRWHQFTAKRTEKGMETLVPGGYSGQEAYDTQTIDIDITAEGFVRQVYQRSSAQAEWQLVYIMHYQRQPNH